MSDEIDVRRLCAAHSGSKPAAAVEPSYLCAGCEKAFTAALADCARLWDSLRDLAAGQGQAGGGRRGPNSQAPTRLDILSLMDPRSRADGELPPAAAIFADWASAIASERRFALPRDTYSQIRFLGANRVWVGEQPWAGAVVRDVRSVAAVLRRLCGEVRHPVGRCQAPVEVDTGAVCGGRMYQEADGSASVRCARCGETWSDAGVVEAWGSLRRLGAVLESGETA